MDNTQVFKFLLGVLGLIFFIAIHLLVGDDHKPAAFTALAAHLVPVTFVPRGQSAPWRIGIDLIPKALLSGCLYVTVFEWIGGLVTQRPVDPIGALVVIVSVVVWAYSMILLAAAHMELLQAE